MSLVSVYIKDLKRKGSWVLASEPVSGLGTSLLFGAWDVSSLVAERAWVRLCWVVVRVVPEWRQTLP